MSTVQDAPHRGNPPGSEHIDASHHAITAEDSPRMLEAEIPAVDLPPVPR